MRSCLQTLHPHSSIQAHTLLWFLSYCNCFPREWFLCPPLQTPFSAPALTLLGSWKGPKENWQMALALKTCLPLLVSFCGPWVPLSCQCDSQGKQSRALNINRDPSPAVCFENPPKSTEETVSLESDRGEVSYLIHFGGKGQRERGPNSQREVSERGRERSLFWPYLITI